MSSLRLPVWGQTIMYVLSVGALCSLVLLFCEAVMSRTKRSESPMGKILKGRNANQEDHSHLVSIQYLHDRNASGRFYAPFCGGAIINSMTIITAGHCFETKPDCWVTDPNICYRIVAGEHDLTREQTEQIHVISTGAIVVHENYDGFHYDNDIAMIHLDNPLQFNNQVKRIPLVRPNRTYSSSAVIAGWGITMPDANQSILQEANVTIFSDDHCENQWGDDYHKEGMLCAGNEMVSNNEVDDIVADSCWGDSGGPLVTTDFDEPEKKYLIGLISWGYQCGYHEYPGLYTRIEAFLDWIKDNRQRGSRKYRRMMRLRRLRMQLQKH